MAGERFHHATGLFTLGKGIVKGEGDGRDWPLGTGTAEERKHLARFKWHQMVPESLDRVEAISYS